MSNGAPHPSTFELRAGSLAARDLTVLAFRGREAISRGYRVDIDVAVPTPSMFLDGAASAEGDDDAQAIS
ncbi:hypothetical protein [Sorangium sp. So ce1335]|uniref:hypothetical protein n=1 Tax=Sorangium sp. So ce1335 TaxID=3133335 RepID=UPI003F643DC5